MDSRWLMCLPPCDAAPALRQFHAMRTACRSAVRRHASLGAALLFSGDCTLALLEGLADEVLRGASAVVLAGGPTAFDSWPLPMAAGEGRMLPCGICRVGYLDAEQGRARLAEIDPAARLQAFMQLFAASDHD